MATEQDQQSRPGSGRLVLQGAALLGGAALLSKLIGTLQKIPLQNLAGDEVFGLYSAVYALAIMWITLAAAGIPTAVSVLVAEREAEGDRSGAQRVARWSFVLLCTSGLAAFAIMQLCAPIFASWIGIPAAASAIRTSSIALLFAPAAAVLRGYRQGQMRMARPAVSQVVEQTARVAFMLGMLFVAIRAGWQSAATTAALHGGLAAGAAVGLAAMLWPRRSKEIWIQAIGASKRYVAGEAKSDPANRRLFGTMQGRAAADSDSSALSAPGFVANTAMPNWDVDRKMESPEFVDASMSDNSTSRKLHLPVPGKRLIRRIIGVALPVAAASVVIPLFGLIDAFSIPRLLQREGVNAAVSIAQFGVYSRGVALLQLVLMAASGVAAALVPAMTAARKLNADPSESVARAVMPLRLAWWLGGAAAIGLTLLAAPIDIALFANSEGSRVILLMAPAALFGTLQAVSSGILQGQGDLRGPAVNLAVAAVLKLALNCLLVPGSGISGAAVGMAAAYGAASLLNALSLRQRLAGVPPVRLAAAWRPATALAAMAAAVAFTAMALGALTQGLPARPGALLVALPGTAVGGLTLAAALIALGAIGPRQWRELPGCAPGSRIDAWLLLLRAALHR